MRLEAKPRGYLRGAFVYEQLFLRSSRQPPALRRVERGQVPCGVRPVRVEDQDRRELPVHRALGAALQRQLHDARRLDMHGQSGPHGDVMGRLHALRHLHLAQAAATRPFGVALATPLDQPLDLG